MLFAALYDGNDGRWQQNPTQESYNDSQWEFEGEPEEPIEFAITSISYEQEQISCTTQGGDGVVKYWFYAVKSGQILFNLGGWSENNTVS